MGASEAASTDFPSVPPSVVEDDGKSLSSGSYVHASQMAASSLGEAPRPRKSKAQLWQDMKINAITRALTLVYTLSLLTIFTRIQLNLLGRRTYLSSVVALASGQQSSTISLENRDDDGYDNVYGNDFEVNRQYLTFSWWLLHRGSKQLMERVMAAVKEVFGPVNIREDISLERLSELSLDVRRKVEGATEQERTQMKWLSYLLPPKDEEAFVVRQAGASENGESPSPEIKHVDPLDAEEDEHITASLRRLLDETSDLVDSPIFCQVLTRVLDAAYSHLVDYRIATESFKITGPSAPGLPESDEPRVTDITETKCKLAHILPVFCKQAHVIAAGSGDLATGVEQEPLGNEYLSAIDRVRDLEAFAAVIYSSNFEYEVAERNQGPEVAGSRVPLERLDPQAVEEEVEVESAGVEKGADVVADVNGVDAVPTSEGNEAVEVPDEPAGDGLEEAWKRALAAEDGEKVSSAPVPVEDD